MSTTRLPVLKEDKPKRKPSRKLTLLLLLLFIALLAVIFFRSSVSRITDIQFQGNKFTTEAELLQQSGIRIGGQFFAVSEEKVAEELKKLSTVKDAVVKTKFPGDVTISVEEFPAVAYELDGQGSLKAILSSGASVPVDEAGIAVEKPILTGWDSSSSFKAKLCKVLGEIPNELTSDISEIVPSPTLSFPDRIKLYTRSRFEVITSISLLGDKVEYLNQVIETEQPGLIKMLEADSYVPFYVEAPDEEGQAEDADPAQE